MKNFLRLIILFFILFAASESLKAQTYKTAGEYMGFIGQQYKEIQKDMLGYMSAVAHGKSARKVESKRKELLQTNKDARKKISSMPEFEKDKSLRDSAVAFLDISFHILNDDYGKIVNMEEVAEQSYDAMEAYLLAQDLASDKLKKAGELLDVTERSFATSHNVTLVEGTDEVSQKMAIASKVSNYQRVIYLIFFKSYKQEMYLLDAMSKKDINAIEQSKGTLLAYATEGLKKLDTIRAYNGDNSLLTSCRTLLEFYKKECEKVPAFTNYFLKEETFQKVKKAFDAKRESDRTQADVDQYNKAANEMNVAVNEYNGTNSQLNDTRGKLIDNWNKTASNFLDKHTPKYK